MNNKNQLYICSGAGTKHCAKCISKWGECGRAVPHKCDDSTEDECSFGENNLKVKCIPINEFAMNALQNPKTLLDEVAMAALPQILVELPQAQYSAIAKRCYDIAEIFLKEKELREKSNG